MALLYADECINRRIVKALARLGYDVLRVIDDLPAGTADPRILLQATRLGRAVITHDHDDYLALHQAWTLSPFSWDVLFPPHPGILVIPHRVALHDPDDAAERIDWLLRSGRPTANRFWELVSGTGWIERA
ncbi:MAG TPA: DUF5615 family PIN-like protein [Thermomicrobiaceae bacterium]|nr:DUF5615 family PIN-like protein [Thermomicrobiaceae bacterium]